MLILASNGTEVGYQGLASIGRIFKSFRRFFFKLYSRHFHELLSWMNQISSFCFLLFLITVISSMYHPYYPKELCGHLYNRVSWTHFVLIPCFRLSVQSACWNASQKKVHSFLLSYIMQLLFLEILFFLYFLSGPTLPLTVKPTSNSPYKSRHGTKAYVCYKVSFEGIVIFFVISEWKYIFLFFKKSHQHICLPVATYHLEKGTKQKLDSNMEPMPVFSVPPHVSYCGPLY